MEQQRAFELIKAERDRQDAKWGKNSHNPIEWYLIAQEEMGEVNKGLLVGADFNDIRQEIVQLAAVCVAWLEDSVPTPPAAGESESAE
jgi:NTP pyrophosphatase (non-canonical NTP hydrolase)